MSEHSDSEVDEIDPSEKWTPEEREQYFNEMEECPLLMKDYTEVRFAWAGLMGRRICEQTRVSRRCGALPMTRERTVSAMGTTDA